MNPLVLKFTVPLAAHQVAQPNDLPPQSPLLNGGQHSLLRQPFGMGVLVFKLLAKGKHVFAHNGQRIHRAGARNADRGGLDQLFIQPQADVDQVLHTVAVQQYTPVFMNAH